MTVISEDIIIALSIISENKTDTAIAVSDKNALTAEFTAEREDGAKFAPVEEYDFFAVKLFIIKSSVNIIR
ncbi:MAG: hypothetical protein IJ391_06240 [Clostridia bacterium]|nr:hypothetical protein [Clostridia bacterium]